MGRNKYSAREIKIIRMLLGRKCAGTRFQQKQIRHQLRVNFEFNISDFGEQGKAFGPEELDRCVERGIIKILDDATIAAMKEKRERDRQRDLEAQAAQLPAESESDHVLSDEEAEAVWKQALAEWEAWENEQKQ
ncbi:MAG: hypothetical protein MJZ36_00935 [Bacteroidaceae bacterium]|nr:hypothetical protein [Bacteroidaceae bacterium]